MWGFFHLRGEAEPIFLLIVLPAWKCLKPIIAFINNFSFSDVECSTLKCQLYFPEMYELLQPAQEHWGERQDWHKSISFLPTSWNWLLPKFRFSWKSLATFRPSVDNCMRCCSPALVGMATGSSIFPTMTTAILVYSHSASHSSALFVFLSLSF